MPQHTPSLQLVRISSTSNSHSGSIKSLNINHSSGDVDAPVVTTCTVVIENNPAATNRLESITADQRTPRTEVKNSNKTLNRAADEVELITANWHNMEADLQVIESTTM